MFDTSVLRYGLTEAGACFEGICYSVTYADNDSQLGEEFGRIRIGGGVALGFGVLSLMSAIMCAVLFAIDAVGDVNGVSDKIPRFFTGKVNTYM